MRRDRSLSLSLSPLRILSTSLSNEFKLVLNEQASIFSFSTPIIHSKSSPNVTTNIINTVKRDHRKEEKKKTISHHSRVISKSRKRSGKSEGERRNFFQTDTPTRYRCTRGQERMERREQRTLDLDGSVGEGRADARRIMALVKGKIALTFMWDLAESISPVFLGNWSSRYWLPPVRKERAWLHRHQPKSISVTRLLDRCHRSTEVSPFA